MPRKKGTSAPPRKRPIERYEHTDKKRINNPPVGLVTPETDPVAPSHKSYNYVAPVPSVKPKQELDYDPHLDPQLVWAGKKEHSSFDVPTVSLHVHERIDPYTIIKAVKKKNGNGTPTQASLFERPEERRPLREEIDFYKHAHGWSNRLIAGDSLLVMNSLLEKEGMAGQVQMVYVDPPYGIKYASNFQPFVNKRRLSENDADDDLTTEPEMLKAFRDTWELGIHSYLTYLRDRLLLIKDLLAEEGSVYVQISDENVALVRAALTEVFGRANFVVTIPLKKKGGQKAGMLAPVNDYILWACKNQEAAKSKFRKLYKQVPAADLIVKFNLAELENGRVSSISELSKETGNDYRRFPKLFEQDFPKARLFESKDLTAGGYRRTQSVPFEYEGAVYDPGKGNCWKHSAVTDDGSPSGMDRLAKSKRLFVGQNQIRFKRYATDFPYEVVTNWWDEFGGAPDQIYVVQTNPEIIKRCILMTTDPGDLVLDITCGSGTTALVAEDWGRRWITCDSSRVALTLAKQRLMTSVFEYYRLAHTEEGVDSGFAYKTVPHVTSTTIANDEPPVTEPLYDEPLKDMSRVRVPGPFTVEAVPAPTVRSLEDIELGNAQAKDQQSLADFRHAATPLLDASIARKGATLRHSEWRDELLKTGMRGKSGNQINFSRVEPLAGTRWLHADAETKGAKAERVVISFGPEHSLLEQRQVEMAWEEARTLVPKPAMIVFAAFEFDPEAAKDIDELTKEKPGMTFLTAQMNADLLTEDLKKKRASNQSFWLVGRPDVDLRQIKSGEHKGKWQLEVNGFDYYNTRTGTIDSGDTSKIAMWLLDTDYDGRSLYPRQVFFPMAAEDEGWARLARNLKAEIDPDLIQAYRGTVSLPFEPGEFKRVAVKVIDDRGIESLKIVEVK
jgi:adenine-specific DNA-methyltransferase